MVLKNGKTKQKNLSSLKEKCIRWKKIASGDNANLKFFKKTLTICEWIILKSILTLTMPSKGTIIPAAIGSVEGLQNIEAETNSLCKK